MVKQFMTEKIKLSKVALKKHLATKTKEVLIDEIASFMSLEAVEQFYLMQIYPQSEAEIAEQQKAIIRHEFFPQRGFAQLRYSAAKKAISNFKKTAVTPLLVADLMLFYVEMGVSFTQQYGDIDEAFYMSIESMYEKALKYAFLHKLEHDLQGRFKKAVTDTVDIGWGFHDTLEDYYSEAFENNLNSPCSSA